MGLGLLTPLFLGGLALLAIPWIVHQIRKPEHKPVRFSSLMFVPQTRKHTVRRRKIQHPLLMLLRMLLLALLALAFTRPYWLTPAESAPADGRRTSHVILLDTSYSMGTQGWFEEARAQALKVLDRMGTGERVAVVAFDAAPRVLAPLTDPADPEAGSIARARTAIQGAAPTWQTTAYLPALQAAQALLLPAQDARATSQTAGENRLIIDLISDFQHAGMPAAITQLEAVNTPPGAGITQREAVNTPPGAAITPLKAATAPPGETSVWKLSSRIELHASEIGAAGAPNCGLTDLAVDETRADQLRIRSKVKNWSADAERPIQVRIVSGGQTRETRSVTVKPGNATQVIFTLPHASREPVEGQIELGEDALAADNRYYFSWNPRPRHDVLLVADPVTSGQRAGAAGRAGARFIQLALPESPELPWAMRTAAQGELAEALKDPARAPEIVLATDLDGLKSESARALLGYVRGGGDALVLLGGRLGAAELNQNLLAPLGLACDGPRTTTPDESSFTAMSWVDLDHRIFMPFRDPRSSDFSNLHFFNYQRLKLSTQPGAQARVLARLEGGDPAIIEARLGEGTAVIWAFGLDLDWTNLPKKASFIPLLHETLGFLTRMNDKSAGRRVGDMVAAAPGAGRAEGSSRVAGAGLSSAVAWQIQAPGQQGLSDFETAAGKKLVLAQPGLLRWKPAGEAGWRQVDAVNIDPRESDPQRIPIAEFKIRLCSSPAEQKAQDPRQDTEAAAGDDLLVKREWGREALGLLFIFLLLETVYATRLAAAAERKEVEVEP